MCAQDLREVLDQQPSILSWLNETHTIFGTPCRRETQRARAGSLDGQDCDLETNLQSGSGAGGVFKSAALEVLRKEERLMTSGEVQMCHDPHHASALFLYNHQSDLLERKLPS